MMYAAEQITETPAAAHNPDGCSTRASTATILPACALCRVLEQMRSQWTAVLCAVGEVVAKGHRDSDGKPSPA